MILDTFEFVNILTGAETLYFFSSYFIESRSFDS